MSEDAPMQPTPEEANAAARILGEALNETIAVQIKDGEWVVRRNGVTNSRNRIFEQALTGGLGRAVVRTVSLPMDLETAIRLVVADYRQNGTYDAFGFTSEDDVIGHVMDTISLESPAPTGATTWIDHGDELSAAYHAILTAFNSF